MSDFWQSYHTQALSTAIYSEHYLIVYPLLGLFNELGEMVEKLEQYEFKYRDLMLEVGDILWYVNALGHDVGLDSIGLFNKAEIEGWAYFRDQLESKEWLNSRDMAPISESMNRIFLGEAGRICGIIKKYLRGDKSTIDIAAIYASLLIILTCLFGLGYALYCAPHEIAQLNLNKLASRQQRGKIRGDGDER